MALTLQNISHRFGDQAVLDDVTLHVAAGEVHALLGENGAGKTTLMRAAYGMLRPDSGMVGVTREGETVVASRGFDSPADARRSGIGMVHQHFTSIPAFTVAENMALAGGWNETGMQAEQRAAALISSIALPLDARARTAELSVAQRQRLEILKALAAEAKILLLDEPTAVLAPREVHELQRAIAAFAASGGAVLLITHKLAEVFASADRVSVLRRGRIVLQGDVADETTNSLARAMLGEDPELQRQNPIARIPQAVVDREFEHVD